MKNESWQVAFLNLYASWPCQRELSWVNMRVGEDGKDGVLPEVQSPFPAASSKAALLQHVFWRSLCWSCLQ